jgi:hypothetical protein
MIADHKKRCIKMQHKYGPLYDAFDQQVEQIVKEDSCDEWKNIRAFYEHFKQKFMDEIQMMRASKRQKI